MTAEWQSISEAREGAGLRLALMQGFPSPWSVAARWVYELKGIPFQKAWRTDEDRESDQLMQWTGQDSLPAAVIDEERPRTHWYSIMLLADRLVPAPRMIPEDPVERSQVAGLGNELLGEMGLLWSVRALALLPAADDRPDDQRLSGFAKKYGSDPAELRGAPDRIAGILGLLAGQLHAQRANDSEYFVGATLSALDFYWAASSVLLKPVEAFGLSDEAMALASGFSKVAGEVDPILIEHRDRMFANHYELPLALT